MPLTLGDLLGLAPGGNGFLDGSDTRDVVLAGCEACPAVFLISITVYGAIVYGPQIVDSIKQMSKGGAQEVGHDYVGDMARSAPGDYWGLAHPCSATEEAAPSLTFLVKGGNDAVRSYGWTERNCEKLPYRGTAQADSSNPSVYTIVKSIGITHRKISSKAPELMI